ncbi:MAG TPA: hypothetical protein VFI33_10790 [Puia sp.]|nr:hypothetical protein [Puia sp.]
MLFPARDQINQHLNPVQIPDPQVPVTHVQPLLDSFKIYTLGPKEITLGIGKMNYDGSGRLTDIHITTTDSTGDRQPLRPDTLDFILTYHGSDSLPISYINYSAGLSTLAARGFLSYDDQARMSQDSGTNSQNSWLYKYQYNGGKIIQSSTNGIDSIIIVNDNVQLWKEFLNIYGFTYGTYPNPFYQPNLANHITPLMVFNSIDIVSKNLFNSSTAQYVGNDPYLITNYSWTTNMNGQVISGIGTDAKTGAVLQYYWFTYR